MSRPGKIRALLATLRIANAPSVVSNVFLGYFLGWAGKMFWPDLYSFDWDRAGLICLAGLLLYFAGNLANDWFDRDWDVSRRPERALPSGLFGASSYLVSAVVLAVCGIALASVVSPASGIPAAVICLLITIYTIYHKRAIWAVVPMGLCRAGLYFLGYLSWWAPFPWGELGYADVSALESFVHYCRELQLPAALGTGLFCYIVGLSLSARYEGMEDAPPGPRVISRALLIIPMAAMTCSFTGYHLVPALAATIPYAIWLALCVTVFKEPIPRYVSALLAGIPLVDLMAAIPAIHFLKSRAPTVPWSEIPHFTATIAVPIVAFVAGRALQKLAPAT
jgi:4-hydroxybenzoate polyprenyltransferase